MQIDFRASNTWQALNERVGEALGINLDKSVVRVYQGMAHALVEVAVGVSKLYPLKKKVFYFKNMDPLYESALIALAKEGYQMMPLDKDVFQSPQEWVNTLDRECLFIMYSVDEPVLGRAYDVSALEKALHEKNIFKIKVSHARHFFDADSRAVSGVVEKNAAIVYGVSSQCAFAILGERGRVAPLTADQLPMPESYRLSDSVSLAWYKEPLKLDAKKVLDFEAKSVADARAFYKPADLRVYDRAIVYWLDLDGHAVIDRLAKKLGFELKPAGDETRVETTSLSRWGGVRTMNFFKNQGLEPNMIRGLVMISHELLTADFEKTLTDVRRSILEDQNGG